MAEIIIVNVVASATIGKELMLQDIAFQLEGSEYDQDRFPGLIYKLAEPKTAVLIFRSGKVVCTGARSIPDVYVAINKVVDKLRDMDMPVLDEPIITIQNIVATTTLSSTLNLIQMGYQARKLIEENYDNKICSLRLNKIYIDLFNGASSSEDWIFDEK